ncbi:hypothetical protein [Catenovulum adriaticum]|uniref:Superfamily III holin-X n=1 Tax=Catenovulum adriaticum TaxID=2984846 RepID=A0ABY7ANH5_9ALTE|nr:hypothetical protein [Catenovulum sp. TS8]WAJ69836.1 hypothetical protein OLW01_11845 [Catenovulum sp. TS8]
MSKQFDSTESAPSADENLAEGADVSSPTFSESVNVLVLQYKALWLNYLASAAERTDTALKAVFIILALTLLAVILVAGVWFGLVAFLGVGLVQLGLNWWMTGAILLALNLLIILLVIRSLRAAFKEIKQAVFSTES